MNNLVEQTSVGDPDAGFLFSDIQTFHLINTAQGIVMPLDIKMTSPTFMLFWNIEFVKRGAKNI